MAQRGWLVRPDHEVDTFDPETYAPAGVIGAVSQQGLAKAVLDGVVLLDRAGGVLSVTVSRAPTGVPSERVTTGAMVEWKDRTDARPQPEQDGSVAPLRAVEETQAAAVDEPVVDGNGVVRHAEEAIAVGHDAFGNEVDESAVPVELRGA